MGKKKRLIIGSVVKGKDGKPDYIKILNDVHLKAGQFLNLESKAEKQKKFTENVEAGKLTGDLVEKIQAQIDKFPTFVRFEIISLQDAE
jgi:hypothetical protein